MISQILVKHCKRQYCNNDGFTILEVMISLAVFSVGILAVAGMQLISIDGNNIAGKYTQGANLGISEIEKIIATAYDDATLTDGTTGTFTRGIYKVDWTVTDSVPISAVKMINVVVRWQIGGDPKTFTTNYYKAVTY